MKIGLIVNISRRPSIRRARVIESPTLWTMQHVRGAEATSEWDAIKNATPQTINWTGTRDALDAWNEWATS